MKTLHNMFLHSLLLIGFIIGTTASGLAQTSLSDAVRGKSAIQQKKADEAKKQDEAKERSAVKKRDEAKKQDEAKVRSAVKKRGEKKKSTTTVKRNSGSTTVNSAEAAKKRETKPRASADRAGTVERTTVTRTVERNGGNTTVERERRNTTVERDGRSRDVVSASRRNRGNNGNNSNVDRRGNGNNNNRGNRARNNPRYRHRHPDRHVDVHFTGSIGRQYTNNSYWRKYHRPSKQFYLSFGWSPFFYLDLTPRVRFNTWIRPIIKKRNHIVFSKEYDRYDYRPGDAIGYTVQIDFDGKTRVYDNFYDRAPQLVEQFYISSHKIGRLEHILNSGRYYDDGHCLYDEYGHDEHPGYATIGYRGNPRGRMQSVSLNLNAPEACYPAYFVDFMEEIEYILYSE